MYHWLEQMKRPDLLYKQPDPAMHQALYVEIKKQHPHLSEPEAWQRAAARAVCLAHPKQEIVDVPLKKQIPWMWLLVAAALLLGFLVGIEAHAQVDCVKWVNANGSTAGTYCAPFQIKAGTNVTLSKSGNIMTVSATAGGTGTVTDFSAGDLSPLFTTSEATTTTTPALTFTITNQAANKIYAGPATGADAAPTFRSLVAADIPSTVTYTIANGTSAMATSAIASATCATAVTTGATGTATTDAIQWGFNGDPTAVTGYAPLTAGMLTIIAYPTAGNVNFKVCNNTASSITPGAITLNWRVDR